MKLDLSPIKSIWNSFVRHHRRALPWYLSALVLAAFATAFAQDDPKAKIKGIKDLAKQGAGSIPQIAGYLSDPERNVRLEAVKAIVQVDTQASLDPLVKATSDNDAEIQIRATDGLVNFYLPGYVDAGIGGSFKKGGDGHQEPLHRYQRSDH